MPCVFCGHPSVTNGHVLPEWLKNITVRPKSLTRRGNVPTTRREPALYAEKARIVCQKRCNGGWMSQIEEAAKSSVTNLVTGQKGTLPPQGQAVTGRWAALAALMACYLRPKVRVPRDYPTLFYGFQDPPQITVVWIASYDLSGGQAESYRGSELPQSSRLVDPSGARRPKGFGGYRMTINVWHLAFKVVVLTPHPDWTKRPTRINVDLDRTVPGVTRIWPITAEEVAWPMVPQIDDVGLSALANAKPIITLV